jgi:hypothetical protein
MDRAVAATVSMIRRRIIEGGSPAKVQATPAQQKQGGGLSGVFTIPAPP